MNYCLTPISFHIDTFIQLRDFFKITSGFQAKWNHVKKDLRSYIYIIPVYFFIGSVCEPSKRCAVAFSEVILL